MKQISFVLFSFFVLLPQQTLAQGLVSCGGIDCNFCDLAQTIDNVIEFVITLMVLVAVLLLAYAGFRLVTSAGDTSAATEAKQLLTNVIIGFVIILAAWTIVDTMLKALTGSNLNIGQVWAPVDCGGQKTPRGLGNTSNIVNEDESNPAGYYSGGTSVTPDLNGLASMSDAGINVADWYGTNGPGRTDTANPAVVAATQQMQAAGLAAYGAQPFQVTAAYTNGVGHSAGSQHYNGLAVDLQAINGVSNAQLVTLAKQAGFTFVLDEGSHVHADMR